MSPFNCPSLFSILSFLEYEHGVWHPLGGCGAVSQAMARIAVELGAEISLGEDVTKITFEGKRAVGVRTSRGEHPCDALVINADFARAMTRLVPDELRRRWTDRKIEKKRFSCSTFMMYLGIDGRYDDLPATYLWSRMNRVSGTRDRKGHEVMGALEGGYQNLVDRLGDRIRLRGGQILTSTPVRFVPCANHRAIGVVLDTGFRPHETVIATQIRPNLAGLLAPELEQMLGPDRHRYLGVVCLVARVRRSVSPYYALNITDRRVPLTSVVETTHVVDPEQAEGHLVYLPKYVNPDSPELERPSAEITNDYFGHLKTMFPSFREEDVIAAQVARARVAEPVHPVGAVKPDPFAVPGLVVASSAQVYPDIVHGQAILGVAERIATELTARLPVSQRRLEAA